MVNKAEHAGMQLCGRYGDIAMTMSGMWFRIFGVLVGALITAFPLASQPAGGSTSQTLIFTPVSTVAIGVSPITLTATASSGLTAFTFTTSSDPGICTVSANKVTIAGVGVCALTASQAGNATYAPASANASIDVVVLQSPISLIAVQSRKVHGAFGPFDIPIESGVPLAGAVSTEPRVGNAGHDIVFQFSGPVNSIGSASAFGTPGIFLGATPTISGSEVRVALSGVPDNHRVTACLSGVNGTIVQTASIGFLAGDVNRSGSVNVVDIIGVKAHAGNAIDITNFAYDVNGDGAIGASDLSTVKVRSGQALSTWPIIKFEPQPTSGTPGNHTPPWSVGTNVLAVFSVAGTIPTNWTVVSGILPPGLTLNPSSGQLTGILTTAGIYTFTVQAATCTLSNVVSGVFTVTIPEGEAMIPVPSKVAGIKPVQHAGLNGAGALYAWAANPARCDNTQPAITSSWQHNIDFYQHGLQGQYDSFDMAPNEALTYAFTAIETGPGQIFVGTNGLVPLPANFLSISTKPCDFDVTKLIPGPTRDFCYVTAPVDNQLSWIVTTGAANFTCKMVPGTTYYLNLRWQDAAPGGANTVDSCAARGLARCGGYVQIRR